MIALRKQKTKKYEESIGIYLSAAV